MLVVVVNGNAQCTDDYGGGGDAVGVVVVVMVAVNGNAQCTDDDGGGGGDEEEEEDYENVLCSGWAITERERGVGVRGGERGGGYTVTKIQGKTTKNPRKETDR